MGILEARKDAKNDVRSEYLRALCKTDIEVRRRVSSGLSRLRALAEITLELQNSDFTVISSPPPPGSTRYRIPSVETIRRIMEDLYHQSLALRYGTPRPSASPRPPVSARPPAVSARPPLSPIISPAQRSGNPRRVISLGNAVRNLGSAFGLRSPDYRRDEIEARNRIEAQNRIHDQNRAETARIRIQGLNRIEAQNSREAEIRRSWRDESYHNLRLMADVAETQQRNVVERARAVNHLPPLVEDDIPASQYNPDNFRPSKLTLKQAAKVMLTFDYELHYGKIRNTFLQYSIKFCGLEPNTGDDLHLAVYFFIEKYFKFQPVIVLCARPVSDPDDPSAVGVLFEKIESALRIFNNRHLLKDTPYSAYRNLATDWIIWNCLKMNTFKLT